MSSSSRNFGLEYSKLGIPTLKYTEYDQTTRPLDDEIAPKTYENNTYIDWHKESTREKKGLETKKWLAIALLAISVGYATTLINLASVWLNDLKKGICLSKIDNWTLLDPYLTCPNDEWYSWSRLFFGSTSVVSNIFVNSPIFIVLSCVMALIAAYIAIEKNQFIRESGIPEIKLIISGMNYMVPEYLGFRTLVHKFIGLILIVSSGLWLGKEGPLVHIACCLQNIWYDFILGSRNTNEALRRELISAATATGISIAFNAPIGGVLFVLEFMPSYFVPTKIMWISFISATIAVVVLTGFRFFTDGQNFYEQNLFHVSFGNFSWLFLETIPFIGIGVLGGFYGYFFIRINSTMIKLRPSIQAALARVFNVKEKYGAYIEIGCIILVTSVLNFLTSLTKLPLNAYLKILFTACPSEDSDTTMPSTLSGICQPSNAVAIFKLLFIATQAFFLSAYTFGVNLPGGVLMPSLAIGATSGRLIGLISQSIQSKMNWDLYATCTETSCLVSPSSYAVIGAASFMTGITKLTVSVVVILFELTGAITYVLPIMLSVMILKYVNDLLCYDNIYDNLLKSINRAPHNNAGYETNQGKGSGLVDFTDLNSYVKNKLPNYNVDTIMVPLTKTKCLCLVPETPYTANSLMDFVHDDVHDGYPIILSYNKPIYIGYIAKRRLLESIEAIQARNMLISFDIDGLTSEIISHVIHYESTLDQSNLYHMNLSPQRPYLRINDSFPIVLVLQMFEKMHLNHLIINSHDAKHVQNMVGFLDRFILSNLLKLEFKELAYAQTMDHDIQEFELGGTTERSELFDIREDRESIELIT